VRQRSRSRLRIISLPYPSIQILARLGSRSRPADDLDDRVEIVERNLEAFQDVLALARLAEQINRAPLDDIDAVIDEAANGLVKPQLPRLPVSTARKIIEKLSCICVCL